MHFTVNANVDIEVDRVAGKFASRDELEAAILEAVTDALEQGDPGSLEGEDGGEYETVEWTVNVSVEEYRPVRRVTPARHADVPPPSPAP